MRLGSQRPVVELVPSMHSTAGGDAADLIAECGLTLDDWQRWVLDSALGEREDGRWAAGECALLVPRQNGKNVVLAAREIAGLLLFGERLIVHSAHKFATCKEHFRLVRDLLEASAPVRKRVKRISFASGQEAIEMVDGARIQFVARSRSTARGYTSDCLVFDEAFDLDLETLGGMLPSLAAVKNPQIWFASSAPDVQTGVLHGLRARGRDASEGRLFFAEWCAESGVDVDDRDVWARTNPAFGGRISEDYVAEELARFRGMGAAGADIFARERLGVVRAEDGVLTDVFAGGWSACERAGSSIVGPVSLALDVSPDMGWASIVAAGRNADGRLHIEVVDRLPKTDWVTARAAVLCSKYESALVVDAKSPAAVLIAELMEAGIEVVSPGVSEYVLACGMLQRFVSEMRVVHLGQKPLDDASRIAVTRSVGDGWVWARAKSAGDISALVAATLALWSCDRVLVPASNLSEMVW